MKQPMKILMTADTLGGVWTYSLELCRALEPQGIQVVLATMGKLPSIRQKKEAESCSNVKLYPSNFKLEWMDDPWEDIEKAGQWLQNIAEREKPDIIHLNHLSHGNLEWNKPVIQVVHSCVWSWHKAVLNQLPAKAWDRYRYEVAQSLKAVDHVATVSEWMANQVERIYETGKPVHVIYNGINPEGVNHLPKEPVVMAMGRLWDEAKNVKVLDQVSVPEPWRIHLAGDRRHPETGRRTEVRNAIHLGLLPRQQALEALARATIFALPARYEPFGLSALEAAHCGTALVLADIPTLREIWQDAALYAHPDDTATWEQQILRLIEDTELRIRLIERAKARAGAFSAKTFAEKYLNLYGRPVPGTLSVSQMKT